MRIKIFVVISIFIVCFLINSYYSLAQKKSWVEPWQKSTISFGIKDTISVKSPNDSIINKEIYKIVGTGVLFYVKVDIIIIPTIVTAKHIFYNPKNNWFPDSLRIRFSWFEDEPIDEYFGIPIILTSSGKRTWFSHPDTIVDLACISLTHLKGDIGIDKIPVRPYSDFATDNDMYQGAKIFVLGYPGSVGMEFWTKAILREGIISWVAPNEPQKNRILIDCNIFPGNSGGPVFKIPTGMDKYGNLVIGGQYKFIGIVSERRFSPTRVLANGYDYIIIDDKGSTLYSFESIGIGVIEPALRVSELLTEFQYLINKEINR